MTTVTIPRNEYSELKRQANAYRRVATRLHTLLIRDPIAVVVSDFNKSGLYTRAFLQDLEDGLRKSSYTKRRNED